MSSKTATTENGIDAETITGPYVGFNAYGNFDHYYWRCEECGLETTDESIRSGCFGCDGWSA